MATQKRKSFHLCRIALLAAMVVLIAGPVAAQAPTSEAQQQWQQLNAQVMEAYQAGDYAKGVASAEQALQLARQAFGPRHPDTLGSLNNLAFLYQDQGRHGEAEPLLREALQGAREVLGPAIPTRWGRRPIRAEMHASVLDAMLTPGIDPVRRGQARAWQRPRAGIGNSSRSG